MGHWGHIHPCKNLPPSQHRLVRIAKEFELELQPIHHCSNIHHRMQISPGKHPKRQIRSRHVNPHPRLLHLGETLTSPVLANLPGFHPPGLDVANLLFAETEQGSGQNEGGLPRTDNICKPMRLNVLRTKRRRPSEQLTSELLGLLCLLQSWCFPVVTRPNLKARAWSTCFVAASSGFKSASHMTNELYYPFEGHLNLLSRICQILQQLQCLCMHVSTWDILKDRGEAPSIGFFMGDKPPLFCDLRHLLLQ